IAEKVTIKDRETLHKIATTAIMSKSAAASKDLLADIAVKAVTSIVEERDKKLIADIDNVQIVKKHGGSINDTELVEGVIVDKEVVHAGMPKRVENAKIALLDCALEIKKTEVDAKIEITDPKQLQAFLAEEENMLKRMVDKVKASGANAVFCQKGIDDLAQHYLAKSNIYAVRRVKESDMKKLAKATGGKLVTRLDDLTKQELGYAKEVFEKKIGEDNLTFVTGCKEAKAVSVLLRGGTEHVVDEMERSVHDALSVVSCALEDGKMITGAGAAATEIALALRDYASTIGGREQMAIESFADAIEVVPRTLAENAGMDPIDVLIDLRKAHKEGKKTVGVDVLANKISDMKGHVIEPIRVGRQAILSATDAAVMILRIDDIIASKAPEKGPPGRPPMPPGAGEEEY
ncbi:MAG: thermosome subunit beta, partial [Candidatus Thermoplasmatota archaeon]